MEDPFVMFSLGCVTGIFFTLLAVYAYVRMYDEWELHAPDEIVTSADDDDNYSPYGEY